jgi:hypothetical protein
MIHCLHITILLFVLTASVVALGSEKHLSKKSYEQIVTKTRDIDTGERMIAGGVHDWEDTNVKKNKNLINKLTTRTNGFKETHRLNQIHTFDTNADPANRRVYLQVPPMQKSKNNYGPFKSKSSQIRVNQVDRVEDHFLFGDPQFSEGRKVRNTKAGRQVDVTDRYNAAREQGQDFSLQFKKKNNKGILKTNVRPVLVME